MREVVSDTVYFAKLSMAQLLQHRVARVELLVGLRGT